MIDSPAPAVAEAAPPSGALAFRFNGEDMFADPSGALFWPRAATLAVADLHLEKGSAYAAQGAALLPPYDTAATLARLEAAVAAWRPRRIAALGDSFHDADAHGRIAAGDAAHIRALTGALEWVWVCGNHDPAPPTAMGGRVVAELRDHGLTLRHLAAPGAFAEISGHYHPKARVKVRAGRRSGRCFAIGDGRLILPAFGAYAGGLDVTEPDLARWLGRDPRMLLIGDRRVFSFGRGALISR